MRASLIYLALCLALAAALAGGRPPAAARAAIQPVGGPVLVSPPDGRDHQRPAVAVSAAGSAVVAWSGYTAATGGFEIFAQRYGADGAAAGAALRVNQYSTGDQRRPAVIMDDDGAFVVAWDGPGSGQAPGGGSVSGSQHVWGRLFSADGSPRGGDMALSRSLADGQRRPALARQPGGDLLVAWAGVVPGDSDGVAFARFTANLVALSAADEVPYAAPLAGSQSSPALAVDAKGGFVIGWQGADEDAQTGAVAYALRARRYGPDGAPSGGPLTICPDTIDTPLRDPALAIDASGNLLAAWAARDAAETRGVIWLRRFAADGAALGDAAAISPPATADRYGPRLALLGGGELLAAWGDATTSSAGAPAGLAARRLSATGAPLADEFYPGLPAAGAPSAAAIASAGGWLLLAWEQTEKAAGGLPLSSVYLRRYSKEAAPKPSPTPTTVPTLRPDERLFLPQLSR